MPEELQEDRSYLSQFARGANGEWVDVPKARRMADAIDSARQRMMREEMERVRASEELQRDGYVYLMPYMQMYVDVPYNK